MATDTSFFNFKLLGFRVYRDTLKPSLNQCISVKLERINQYDYSAEAWMTELPGSLISFNCWLCNT